MRRHWKIVICAAFVGLTLVGTTAARAADPDKAWLGVMLGETTGDDVEGVRLTRIIADSPAHEGGLRARDIVIAVDGQPVSARAQLVRLVQQHSPGGWIPITVSRNGRERDLRVRLDSWPASSSGRRLREGWIGIEAIELPEPLREHFGSPPEAGVMISRVDAGSPAEAGGLEIGDVLFEIDGEPVGSTRVLRNRIAGGGVGNTCEIEVARYGNRIVVEARIVDAPTKTGDS